MRNQTARSSTIEQRSLSPASGSGSSRSSAGCASPEGPRHRNCNVNLDDLDWERPDLNCERQQARGIPRNLQLDQTMGRLRTCMGTVWRQWMNVAKPSGYSVGRGIWE